MPTERVLRVVRPLWARVQENPKMAGPTLSEGLRAARSLGSHERPIAGDMLSGMIRHSRALAMIAADPIAAWLSLAQDGPSDQDDPPDAFAIATSMPEDIAAQWWERLGPEAALTLARTLSERAPVCIRVLRGPVSLPVPVRQLTERTWILEGRCNLLATEAYLKGQIEIQDSGSQEIVEVLAAGLPAGAKVLDMCAGAGGKSLALAAMGFRVQAWDIRPQALKELEKRANRAQLNIRIGPPQGRYDAVLVDAPCSGTGVLRRHPENRWKLNFPTDIQEKLLRQARALADRVVYATCALTLAENEALVRRVAAPKREQTLWPVSGGNDGFYWAEL